MKEVVIGVLTNRNSQKVSFLYTGSKGVRFVVTAVDLHLVATAIYAGTIDVQPGAPDGMAIYTASEGGFGKPNTMYIGNNNASQEIFHSLFVHESIHAIFDLRKVTLPWLDNEAIAYIAQGFYLNSAGVVDGMSEQAYLGSKIAKDFQNGGRDSLWLDVLWESLLNDAAYSQYINKNFVGDG